MKLKMIVEWSAGSLERYDWKNGVLVPRNPPWPAKWGTPPVNYGLIEGYFNPADNAELDAIWADPSPIAVGTVLEGEVLGMIWVNDLDHKIILGNTGDLERLPKLALNNWFNWRDPKFLSNKDGIEFLMSLVGNNPS